MAHKSLGVDLFREEDTTVCASRRCHMDGAEQTGFASGKQLSTTFRQQLGTTPSEYRRRHRLR